ncbi:MAG: argininosuccinate synthase, partial [Nitrososphaeria archaeon]|nr:argininosuccinate synthase [Nitrososphaeria archaeon]NIQ32590.1 argininosuccinate synthase [Nitrososphaeria archaeon]
MGSEGSYEKIASFVGRPGEIDLCVLLYSGGLDTSCMLKWIQENYGCDVISLTLDIGQRTKDFDEIEKKARKLGVKNHYKIDIKKEFAEEYIFRALKANALYEDVYPVSTAIARPLMAKWGVEIAKDEGADAIAHGCTGKGNDQVRFDISIMTLSPKLKIVSPVVEWNMTRKEEIEYAKLHGIPLEDDSPYSIDENLWGRSIECGILEHPEEEPPDDVFAWTVSPQAAPDKPEHVEIAFEKGIPVSLNGENLEAVDLISQLNGIGGRHGVGRLDHMEDRIVGLKSREVYECPAASILIQAHMDLEKSVSTRHEVMFKRLIDQQWSILAYSGLWVDPLREDLEAFIDKVNEKVDGTVRTKLFKGHSTLVGRKSDSMLYDLTLATYG